MIYSGNPGENISNRNISSIDSPVIYYCIVSRFVELTIWGIIRLANSRLRCIFVFLLSQSGFRNSKISGNTAMLHNLEGGDGKCNIVQSVSNISNKRIKHMKSPMREGSDDRL